MLIVESVATFSGGLGEEDGWSFVGFCLVLAEADEDLVGAASAAATVGLLRAVAELLVARDDACANCCLSSSISS